MGGGGTGGAILVVGTGTPVPPSATKQCLREVAQIRSRSTQMLSHVARDTPEAVSLATVSELPSASSSPTSSPPSPTSGMARCTFAWSSEPNSTVVSPPEAGHAGGWHPEDLASLGQQPPPSSTTACTSSPWRITWEKGTHTIS